MNVFASINTQKRHIVPAAHSLVADTKPGLLAGGRDGVHCRDRGRVIDDSFKMRWQIHHLPEPIEDYIFELGRGGRGPPQHAFHIEGCGQHFAKNTNRAGRCRKQAVKIRVIPMCDGGKDQFIEIAENISKIFTGFWRRLWQIAPEPVRFDL